MKKILIINTSAFTIGNIAMSECMFDQVLEVFPDVEIVFESSDLENHKKYLEGGGRKVKLVKRLFDVKGLTYSPHYLSLSFLKKNFKFIFSYLFDAIELFIFSIFGFSFSKREIFKEIRTADLIIVGGGDDITKHYGFFIRIYVLYMLKLMNKKVIIYASTIGPFTGFSKFFVIKCLKKVDLIFCRDEKSYSFLVSSGLSKDNVKRTADCVLLLRENNSKRVANLVHDLDISKKTIGIFLKSFIYFTKTEFCKYLFDVKKVVIELERQNYRIIFFSANNVDCKLTKKFIKDYSIRNPFINLMDFSASESKKILANLGLIITSRMHPAILGTTAGTVVIGVSDESKMLEYLKIINNSKLYLDAKDYSFFSIINLIQYVYSNKEKISFDLKEGVLDAQKLASKNVLYMRDFIGKDSDFHEGSCN